MNSFKYYISKISEFMTLDVYLARKYGIKAAYYDFLKHFIFRRDDNINGKKYTYLQYENLKRKLSNKYDYIIDKYRDTTYPENIIEETSNIWIFWWQGIDEKTPTVVRDCIESIYRFKGNHSVKVITQYNYKNYVEIQQDIVTKFNEGKITITHFSDILRVELLYKYGGIWMDATIFLNEELSKDIYNMPFYTIKHGLFSEYHVCKGKWSGYFLGSAPNNPFIGFLRDCFNEYWKNEDRLICYLLIDCFIAIGYENIASFKRQVDEVRLNNENVYYIDDFGNQNYDPKVFKDKVEKTYIFKMHYKREFVKFINGNITNYGHVCKYITYNSRYVMEER